MDTVDPARRSANMRAIRSSDTKPEVAVRRFLHARGFRYRLKAKVLGFRPDVVLTKYRTAVFVHGCFWHRHKGCRYATTPGSHEAFWEAKFAANVARDGRQTRALLDAGWRVVVVWECYLRRGLDLEWLPAWIRKGEERFAEWPKAASPGEDAS